MLGWWSSGVGVQEHDQGSYHLREHLPNSHNLILILLPSDDDFPETPAPVFAARAFRSAIFGTPHPADNLTTRSSQPIRIHSKDDIDVMADKDQLSESTSKKQGILLTPGTIGRKKSVSFGAGVVDNEGRKGMHGRSGIPNDCPGKFPSPYTPKVSGLPGPSKQTSLTKAMENSREKKKPTRSNGDTATKTVALSPTANKNAASNVDFELDEDITDSREESDLTHTLIDNNTLPDYEGDMTFDLNKPHSQSGRYWKSEYERYHQEAYEEMKKLVKYRELAKSFAKKKDDEAMSLSQKLKEEQHKVTMMEEKVARLSTYIADRRLDTADDRDAPELMRQLARQRALTEQYRAEVNSFQQAMDERNADTNMSGDHRRTLYKIQRELKKARDQLKDMNSLRSDLHGMKLNVSAAERQVKKLNEENSRLQKELVQVKEDLKNRKAYRDPPEGRTSVREKEYSDVGRAHVGERFKRGNERATRMKQSLQEDDARVSSNQAKPHRSVDEVKPRRHSETSIDAEAERQRRRQERRARADVLISDHKPAVPAKDDKPVRMKRRGQKEDEKPWVKSELADVAIHPDKATEARKARTALLDQENQNIAKSIPKPTTLALRSIPIFELKEKIPQTDGNKAYDFKRTLAKHTSDAFNVGLMPTQQVYPQVRAGAGARQRRLSNVAASKGAASRVATPRKVLLPEKAEAARKRLEQRNALKKRAAETAETSGFYMSTIR